MKEWTTDAQNFGVLEQLSQLKILSPCVRSPCTQTTGVSVASHRISTLRVCGLTQFLRHTADNAMHLQCSALYKVIIYV